WRSVPARHRRRFTCPSITLRHQSTRPTIRQTLTTPGTRCTFTLPLPRRITTPPPTPLTTTCRLTTTTTPTTAPGTVGAGAGAGTAASGTAGAGGGKQFGVSTNECRPNATPLRLGGVALLPPGTPAMRSGLANFSVRTNELTCLAR